MSELKKPLLSKYVELFNWLGIICRGGYGVSVQGSASGANPLSGKKSVGVGVTTPSGGISYGYGWKINM